MLSVRAEIYKISLSNSESHSLQMQGGSFSIWTPHKANPGLLVCSCGELWVTPAILTPAHLETYILTWQSLYGLTRLSTKRLQNTSFIGISAFVTCLREEAMLQTIESPLTQCP